MDANGDGEQPGAGEGEIDRLAGIAGAANIVEAVADLNGNFRAFMQRETDRYFATAGADASDAGLAEHMRARWAEAQRCWAADVNILTGAAK